MIIMIPLALFTIVLLTVFVYYKLHPRGVWDEPVLSEVLLLVASVMLVVVPLTMAEGRNNTRVKLAEYRAMFDTIRDTKANNAGLVKDVAVHQMLVRNVSNANEWIRGQKAKNAGIYDAWVADEIDDAEEFRW